MQAWVLCTWTLQEIILQLWKYNLFPPILQTALISRRDKRLKKTLVNTSDQSPYLHSFSDEQVLTKNTFVKVVLFDDSALSLWRRWLWTKRGRTDVNCGGWKCFLAHWQMLLKVKKWRWLNISAVLQCLHYIAVHQIKNSRTAVKSTGHQVFSLCPYQHFTQVEWRKLSLDFLIFIFPTHTSAHCLRRSSIELALRRQVDSLVDNLTRIQTTFSLIRIAHLQGGMGLADPCLSKKARKHKILQVFKQNDFAKDKQRLPPY